MSHIPPVHATYEHSLTQTVPVNTRTKLLFNGLGPKTSQAEMPGLYSTATQKLAPLQQEEIYLLRVELVATATVLPVVQPILTLEWDYGSPQDGTKVFGRDIRLGELSLNALPFLYNTFAFVGPNFIANGASFYVTPRGLSATISGATLTVIRIR